MSRDIKFRAWHKGRKCIFPEYGAIAQVDLGVNGECTGIGVAEYRQIDEDGNGDWDLFNVPSGQDNLILMQYTGLKDKNGKEIYEGDIVETIYRDNLPHKGIIYFQPTRLNWSVKHSGFTNQDLFVYSRPDCSVGIIGNIYENPELVET